MKTIIITAAAALFAANVGAATIYHGLGEGNPDLSPAPVSAADFAGVQPSVGAGVSVYHGLAEGNGDLGVAPLAFAADFVGTKGTDPDIYGNLRGNPDLSF
jgi:hypothetical protein